MHSQESMLCSSVEWMWISQCALLFCSFCQFLHTKKQLSCQLSKLNMRWQSECNPQVCVSHEASSNKTLNYSILWMDHRQMEQGLEQKLQIFCLHKENSKFHFEWHSSTQCIGIARVTLKYRRSVSDQLALAANVRLRKHNSYIRYGNV